MVDETQDLINMIYEKKTSKQEVQNTSKKILRKSSKAKYQIFDELEFTRGREVLGEIIVHGMMASGGTDIDWLIEHKGSFIIFRIQRISQRKQLPQGQMIAYEKLHEKLNLVTKCYLYIVGCDDIDFSNPDSPVWIFEMSQWLNNIIPKNITDIYDQKLNKQNKFIVYREYMEEINVEKT